MRPSSVPRARVDGRRLLSASFVVLDVVVLALVVAGVAGPARQLSGLVFFVLVPGWSIVGLARLHDAVLELCLSMATGLAALVVLAQFVITVDAWHLVGVEIAVCVACLASLVFQLVRPRDDRRALR
jgi:uncharacterized membrane protein